MSQLSEIPGDSCALPTQAEAFTPLKRGRRRQGEVALTREEKLARLRARNNRVFSVPPVGKECDCGQVATLWTSGKDAVCQRCDYFYSLSKRMEIQGRMIGLERKLKLKLTPIVETQLDLFHAEVVLLPDEITIIGHGIYHLHVAKEAA